MKKDEEYRGEEPGYERDEKPGSRLRLATGTKSKNKKVAKSKEKQEVKKKKKKIDITAALEKLKKRKRKRSSESGKYSSLRNMMEVLFAENPDISDEELLVAAAEEYPESKIAQGSYHQAWYRTHIVSRKDFRTLTPDQIPDWAK